MNKQLHSFYIWSMVAIVIFVTGYLAYSGITYYQTPLEERFYHPEHDWFKPSGAYGHGLGIVGTFLILFGVVIYIARKRYGFLQKQIRLKYLLEFHIFLCTLGPIMVLFHTAFKFGGIVTVAFWSMVTVVLSGVIGRFIYIQIPRTLQGRALSLKEVKEMQTDMAQLIGDKYQLSEKSMTLIEQFAHPTSAKDRNYKLKDLKKELKVNQLSGHDIRSVLKAAKKERILSGKIARLKTMQRYFKYWHVAHLPFALIMLIIVLIHIGVTLAFGYKWIF